MPEFCDKCGEELTHLMDYKRWSSLWFEYTCINEKCENYDKKKIFQVCPKCEHERCWWEN